MSLVFHREAEDGKSLDSDQGKDEVQGEIKQALYRGVQGVPNFLINSHYLIRGAQPPDVMVQILEQALKD